MIPGTGSIDGSSDKQSDGLESPLLISSRNCGGAASRAKGGSTVFPGPGLFRSPRIGPSVSFPVAEIPSVLCAAAERSCESRTAPAAVHNVNARWHWNSIASLSQIY